MSEWIDLIDEEPEIGQKVLIAIPVCGHINVEGAKYKGENRFSGDWCSVRGDGCAYKVTHWMVKPDDPKPRG